MRKESRVVLSMMILAVTLIMALPAFCQLPNPPLLGVTRYQVRFDRVQEFQEVQKQIADAYKKAAPKDQFRVMYRTTVGNVTEYWQLTPLSKFADRDGENPYNKISTEQERLTRSARLNQYVERVQTSIDRTLDDLTVMGTGAKFPPAFVRYIRIRVRPGSANEFINTIKTDIVPAVKKLDGAVLRVRQTVWGGNTNDFIVAAGFEKWALLDDTTSLPKAMGGDQAFRKFQDKMTQIEAGVEQYILRYLPDLSYYPSSAPTTTGR